MTLERYESEMRSKGNNEAADRAKSLRLEYGDIPLPRTEGVEITTIETEEQADDFAKSVSRKFAEYNGIENQTENYLTPLVDSFYRSPGVSYVIFYDGHRREDNYPRLETVVFLNGDTQSSERTEAEFLRKHATLFFVLNGEIDTPLRFRHTSLPIEEAARQSTDNRVALGSYGAPLAFASFKR